MKAVVCHDQQLAVQDLSPPQPGNGQVLLEVLRCGVCGSDLHAREHCDELADVMVEIGYEDFMRSKERIVFGHEFCGQIAEYGPSCRRKLPTSTPVVALPLVRRAGSPHAIGLSAKAPGAYAEQVVVEEVLTLPVPNGLSPDLAALTEPLSVAWHAVRLGELKKGDVAIVIGCGPIGLAVIALLKTKRVETVVASDFSAGRRALATACGADIVVDPAHESPYQLPDRGHLETLPAAVELSIGTMDKLARLPLPWHHVWRAAEKLGARPQRPVIFECVGLPGVIDQIVTSAPLLSRVVVAGVSMGGDKFRPAVAVNKQLELRFAVGYTPLEFRDTLHMLAEGKINADPLLTGTVGLPGVANAFEVLAQPERHAKILIDPKSPATEPTTTAPAA